MVIDDAVRCPLATGLRGCGRWECVGMLLGSEHGHSGTKIKAKKKLIVMDMFWIQRLGRVPGHRRRHRTSGRLVLVVHRR